MQMTSANAVKTGKTHFGTRELYHLLYLKNLSNFSKKCKNSSTNFQVLWLQAAISLQWLQIAGNSLPK